MATVTDPDALANLYPEAAAYVAEHWAPGRLEARSKSIRSSQALCVSVLMTLYQRPPDARAAISAAICKDAGLAFPLQSAPDVNAEVREHGALLGELGAGISTALDGLLTANGGVMTIESKFTERAFGPCGQTTAKKVKPPDPRFNPEHPSQRFVNCNGDHAVGSDQKWSTMPAQAACRLTVPDGKRMPRRYWDVAPKLFKSAELATPRPCPFATDAYQLMRNLAFAHEWAVKHELSWFGFLVILVDGAPKSHVLRDRVAAFKKLLKPEIWDRVGVTSYEHVAALLSDSGEHELSAWLNQRLDEGLKP